MLKKKYCTHCGVKRDLYKQNVIPSRKEGEMSYLHQSRK